jgi:GR25 family glycosyltransferase involved in LPS biosynthesis
MDAIYWINLNKSTDRKKHMQQLLHHDAFHNIPNIRIPAIDADKLVVQDIIKLPVLPVTNNINLRVTTKEYACLLSHLGAIKEFSLSNYEHALILEDDASLDLLPYWHATLHDVLHNAPANWGIIKLCAHDINSSSPLYKKLEFPCFKTQTPKCSTSALAYIISKSAAIKLIKKLWNGSKYELPNILHIADYFLYIMCTTYEYKYPFFIPRKNNNSNIQVNYKSSYNNMTRRKLIRILKKNKSHRKKSIRKGGSRYYYPYNTKPIMFTNVSNRQQGGFLGFGDLRSTLLPPTLVNIGRDFSHSISAANSAYNGEYPGVNPNWRIQPINKI